MLELRIINAGQPMPLYDLPAILGRRGAARELGDTIEGLISFLDDLGGDPDLEDSETGSSMVDERGRYLGPDVVDLQDEDREPDDDAQGDVSWTEWHTRGRHKLSDVGSEVRVRMGGCQTPLEDDEDDDPDTGVEDGPFDPEEDRCMAGDDGCGSVWSNGHRVWGSSQEDEGVHGLVPTYGIDQTTPLIAHNDD